MEAFKCDIANVLQNDNHTVLQKLMQSCQQFRSHVTAKIEKRLLYEKHCTEQTSVNTEKISQLQQEIDTVKANMDDTVLQQKIIEKKISSAIKSQENLQKDLDKSKGQRETLTLDMVDIQLEIEERKRKKILQWDAIKRACNIYKTNLDIHICVEEEKDRQRIKITFFTHNKATRDKYFIQLLRNEDKWTVEQIEPKLNKEHLDELSSITEFAEHFKVSDITLFLCQVRDIYLKYYIRARRKVQNG